MKAIKATDWGKIYAFIWLDARQGTGEYKRKFEQDPALAVKEITRELGIVDYDCLFEVPDDPNDLNESQLEDIMNGKDTTSFHFFLRLTC